MPTRVLDVFGDLRNAAAVTARCTRELILAHFDTAAQTSEPMLGAERSILSSRLREAGITHTDWNAYESLWRELGGGRFLCSTDKYIHIIWRRNRNGRFSEMRPGVFAIVDHLLGHIIPPSLLADWYKEDLRRHFGLEDCPPFIAFTLEWLNRFNDKKTSTFDRQELMSLVSDWSGASSGWAPGLIELLDFLAILQYTRSNLNGYRVKFRADSAFAFANLFGKCTGIEGLDYLLFGGLWVPGGASSRENVTALISGDPGLGKSTLALGMATQVAARGGCAIYFRFEADEASILRQISQFYRKYLPFIEILSQAGTLPNPTTGYVKTRGKLLISDVPNGSQDNLFSVALAYMAEHAKGLPERMVVFDPISAFPGYGVDEVTWRSTLAYGSAIMRAAGCTVIYVAERKSADESRFDDHMVDVGFRLFRRESNDYPFRYFEILKTRWQASHRGPHVCNIEADSGFRVFPSSITVANARRLRGIKTQYAGNRRLEPGIHGFATAFSTEENVTDNVSWWRHGSVTALIGPRGTLKTPFAHEFAAEVRPVGYQTSCSLLLNFSDEFLGSYRVFQRGMQRDVPFGARYDLPIGPRAVDGIGPTLSYLSFRSGYIAAGHVLATIRQVISEKRRAQTPITRVAMTDLGNLQGNYPELYRDRSFLPTLCDLFRSEEITQVSVYSCGQTDNYDYVLEQIRSGSENIIEFSTRSLAAEKVVVLRIARSWDASHYPGFACLSENVLRGEGRLEVRRLNSAGSVGHVADQSERASSEASEFESETL